jgi:hypothetical protein
MKDVEEPYDSHEFLNEIFNARGNEGSLKKCHQKYDLDNEFLDELKSLFTEYQFKKQSEFEVVYNREFKNFVFYFKIGIFHKLDNISSAMVRNNELIQLSNLPENLKQNFFKMIHLEKSKGKFTSVIADKQGIADYWILKIKRKSRNLELATEYAHRELGKSMSVINILNNKDFSSFYKNYHPCYIAMEGNEYRDTFGIVDVEENFFITVDIKEKLDKISRIYRKREKGDIDRRILKALDVYNQIQKSTDPVSKIVIYMTILENLLIDKSDKDYLTWKLAERIAFLIGDDKQIMTESNYKKFENEVGIRRSNSKFTINRLVNNLYSIRSQLVHSNESNPVIGHYDKDLLIGHNILKEVLSAFLDLEEKGIKNLKGKDGLMDFLDKIKYDFNPFSFDKAHQSIKEDLISF